MISVVIPSYKNLELCKQAVASVMKQKECDYEVIIADDTPGNDIEEWVTSYSTGKIRYYHNVPSKGAIDNWNYGLSLAMGENIILLHHDESFANDDFLKQVEQKLKDSEVVVHGRSVMFGDNVKKDRVPLWFKRIGFAWKYPLFTLNFIGPCACVAFRKSVAVDFDPRLHWKVDTEWYYRLFDNAKSVKYFDTPEIISHHGHQGQITNNINIAEVAATDIKIIKDKYNSLTVNFFLWIGKLLYKLK